jgi:hypothetical protein
MSRRSYLFIGGWVGWTFVLSGTNVRIFSFGRREREENVSKTVFLLGNMVIFAARKEKKHVV